MELDAIAREINESIDTEWEAQMEKSKGFGFYGGNRVVLSCNCGTFEHEMFIDHVDSNPPELYITFHLAPLYPWYKRIPAMWNYLRGKVHAGGHFDTFEACNLGQIQKLHAVCHKLMSNAAKQGWKYNPDTGDMDKDGEPNG